MDCFAPLAMTVTYCHLLTTQRSAQRLVPVDCSPISCRAHTTAFALFSAPDSSHIPRHGEESRQSQKTRQNSEIEGAKF
jgi:hypothetical protein